MLNIYDIAKLAGVSYATVSRVINDKSDVKKETRDRVKKILDDNDYLPNSFARGLANRGMKIIGIIVIDVRNIHHINTAFFIEKEFAKFGYSSIIAGCGVDYTKQEDYLRVMAGRNVDGLVLVGSRFQNDSTKKSLEKYFSKKPVVIANGYINIPNVCGIVLDEKRAVSEIVDSLFKKGHRNIGFVNDYVTYSAQEKQAGFVQGLRNNDILFNEKNIIHMKTDLDVSEAETRKFLTLNKSITALIYSEDIMAVGGVKACYSMNIHIPRDINIIGFNNSIYSDISSPRISSIDNKILQMGEMCSSSLNSMLLGEKIDSIIKINPEFIAKETTNF